MRILISILFFYKKLIIPSLIFSLVIGLAGMAISGSFSLKYVGFAYIIFCPFYQYFIYEIVNKNEYYFYYNMGLNRISLWLSTIIISVIIGIILIVL